MKQVQKGFTLIELMIVVAIIGILAAIAIPQYQNFIARGQVTEALNLLSGAKTAIEDEVAQTNAFPAKAAAISLANTLGIKASSKYVAGISISTESGDSTGTVTATFQNKGVAKGIEDTQIDYLRDANGDWTCDSGATKGTPDRFLPKTCKL